MLKAFSLARPRTKVRRVAKKITKHYIRAKSSLSLDAEVNSLPRRRTQVRQVGKKLTKKACNSKVTGFLFCAKIGELFYLFLETAIY